MEEDFQEFSVVQEEQGVDPAQDPDWVFKDQQNQRLESFKQDPPSLHSDPDQVDVQGEVEVKHPDPPENQIQIQDSPQVHDGCQQDTQESGLCLVHQELIQALHQPALDQASPQDQNQTQHHLVHHSQSDPDQDLMTTAASHEALESGGVPALIVTRAEAAQPAVAVPVDPSGAQRPADLVPVTNLSSSNDGGDMICSDLLSLRSDSLSLTSEPTVSRRSEEDDTRSVTASSVTSLFHRVQLDPLEKAWLRSSAVGNTAAQRQLLEKEPSLVLKKDFMTTALHWAAKQGRQDVVDMMLRSGADVNVRSMLTTCDRSLFLHPPFGRPLSHQHGGYTALHLAAIHGHQHIVHALVNTHNAKTSLRDYHGKMAVQYWSGCSDIFNKPDCQSEGRFSRGRRTQRYALPSLLLSRSRSQGQLNLEFGVVLQSSSHDSLDLQL